MSYESGETEQLPFIGQSIRKKRDTWRGLQGFAVFLEYSAETNQHKHVHKILEIGDLKQLEGIVSSAHTVVAIGIVTTSQTRKFRNS